MRPRAVLAGWIDNGNLPRVPAFTPLARLDVLHVHRQATIHPALEQRRP